jgi:hypothetical protein
MGDDEKIENKRKKCGASACCGIMRITKRLRRFGSLRTMNPTSLIRVPDQVLRYMVGVWLGTVFLEIPLVVCYASFLSGYQRDMPYYPLAVTFLTINFLWQFLIIICSCRSAWRLIDCWNTSITWCGARGIIRFIYWSTFVDLLFKLILSGCFIGINWNDRLYWWFFGPIGVCKIMYWILVWRYGCPADEPEKQSLVPEKVAGVV